MRICLLRRKCHALLRVPMGRMQAALAALSTRDGVRVAFRRLKERFLHPYMDFLRGMQSRCGSYLTLDCRCACAACICVCVCVCTRLRMLVWVRI